MTMPFGGSAVAAALAAATFSATGIAATLWLQRPGSEEAPRGGGRLERSGVLLVTEVQPRSTYIEGAYSRLRLTHSGRVVVETASVTPGARPDQVLTRRLPAGLYVLELRREVGCTWGCGHDPPLRHPCRRRLQLESGRLTTITPGRPNDDPRAFIQTEYFEPAWSPAGKRLALVRRTDPASTSTTILLVQPDGSGLTRLTSGIAPVWSPKGSSLLFSHLGSPGLFTVAPATGRAAHQQALGQRLQLVAERQADRVPRRRPEAWRGASVGHSQ